MYVTSKLQQYGMIKELEPKLNQRILLALNWSKDMSTVERKKVHLTETEKEITLEFANGLATNDPKTIQYSIFEVAKKHSIEPKKFFELLYRILLGTTSGPRLGPYIVDFGIDKVKEILLSVPTGQSVS
jgi:lysyl-tRNA synthetase class 1